MTKEKMTVHKALCELKVLDDRIEKSYHGKSFAFANKHSNTKVNGIELSAFIADAKDALASAQDLIKRHDAIKRAVVLSNANTTVEIGGKVYTVAEAIEMKNNGIPFRRELFRYLNSNREQAMREAKLHNDKLDDLADTYVRTMYASSDMKNLADDVKRSREDYIKMQTYEVVDAVGMDELLKKMDEEISSFMIDVDAALSVSNAITEIEISY